MRLSFQTQSKNISVTNKNSFFFSFEKNYDFDDDSWFLPTANNNDGDDIDDKKKKRKKKKQRKENFQLLLLKGITFHTIKII